MTFLRFFCFLLLLLSFNPSGLAQFNTGTITIDGQKLESAYVSGSNGWSMAWDDTYLYFHKTAANQNDGLFIFLDVNPLSLPSGGTNSNGSLTSPTHYDQAATLPFRADVFVLANSGGVFYQLANGSGGWGSNQSSGITRQYSGNDQEIRIAWSSLGISGRPTSFLWAGYYGFNNGNFDHFPTQNPGGDDPREFFYQKVASTDNDGNITNPFASGFLCFETRGDYGYSTPTPIHDMTINDAASNHLRIQGNISVSGNLNVGSNSGFRADGANRVVTFTGNGGSITNAGTMFGEFGGNTITFVFDGNTTLNSDIDVRTATVNVGKTLNCQSNKINSNSSGGTVSVNGTLLTSNANGFSGSTSTTINSTNNSSITLGSGSTIDYSSASAQTLTGRSDYANVTISGGGTKTLGGNATLTGTLTLTSGKLTLGTNKLTLGSSATISGASSTNYIVTDNTGTIERPIAASNSFIFPVGPSASAYNPLTIALDGTGGATFNVRVQGSVNPSAPNNDLAVQRTWNIDKGAGSVGATLTFQWLSAEHGGSFSALNGQGVFRHNGSVYEQVTTIGSLAGDGTSGNPYTASTVTTLSTFSPFIIGQAGGLPVQLSSFTGTLTTGNRVRLEWRTVSELNNLGFYIQKRLRGSREWSEIPNSFVAGRGTTSVPQSYSYTDAAPIISATEYRLRQVDLDGAQHFSDPIVVDFPTSVREAAPRQFALLQNYPNPFNPSTSITFSVEQTDRATLAVYNALGQHVATLFDGIAEAGQYYNIAFSAEELSSGVYFYRLESGKQTDMKKLLLLR